MQIADDLFDRLARSRFRARFRLGAKESSYLAQRGKAEVLEHARQFIAERLAPAQPASDGRQTPLRGHPVFIAQHATATCCRGCLQKWHAVPRGRELTQQEIDYIVNVIEHWLNQQPVAQPPAHRQQRFL